MPYLYLDGGGSGRSVDERQLAEAAALADRRHPVVVHVHLQQPTAHDAIHVHTRIGTRAGDVMRTYYTVLQ